MSTPTGDSLVESRVPARLDRLPWTAWHTRLVLALTAMAFTALEPQRTDRADWAVSLPEPQAAVVPTFR